MLHSLSTQSFCGLLARKFYLEETIFSWLQRRPSLVANDCVEMVLLDTDSVVFSPVTRSQIQVSFTFLYFWGQTLKVLL